MIPLAIVGPTATGKTDIALRLAASFDAEILVCDSMTVYRGIDIGTAKPSKQDRKDVPHHLVDITDATETFNVARFQEAARTVMADLEKREKRALIVGGSGLYFRAIVDDLEFPPTDADVRARIDDEDVAVLLARLAEVDPAAAATATAGNKRRVVRALEVLELTGRPFSSFREAWDRRGPCVTAALDVPPELADQRIRARLYAQLEAGLLDECSRLRAAGISRTAAAAIPYRDAFDLLDRTIDEETFIERAAKASRKLAARQRTWFRADPRVRWFDSTVVANAEADIKAYFSA